MTLPDDVPVGHERTNAGVLFYALLVFVPMFAGFAALFLLVRRTDFTWVQALGAAALVAAVTSVCYFLLLWLMDRRLAEIARRRPDPVEPGGD